MSIPATTLSKRELQVAELFAWGASKKEVASRLFISERTVENHARSIYEKVGCSKVNELSAWWFCHRYGIPQSQSPLRQRLLSLALLALLAAQLAQPQADYLRLPARSNGRTLARQRNREEG